MLDVFFLSYDEPFADEHYELLQLVAPHAKRVHGIKGIYNGHKECARQAMTENFYVIDADAILEPDLNLTLNLNGINKIIYLFGVQRILLMG